MRPACSQDANSLQLWEILQSTSPERGIGSLNCPSKTPYYSMRRAVRPDNSAELCEEFVAEAFPLDVLRAKTRRHVGSFNPADTHFGGPEPTSKNGKRRRCS